MVRSITESRASARMICELLSSISVRDEFARDWLRRCSGRPVAVVPDPAFMLQPASEQHALSMCARSA